MIQYPNTYIVWDLETSGLEKEACKILEIGCITVHDGAIVERKNWILNHGIEIPEKITELTGITQELVTVEGNDPKQCMEEFLGILLSNQEAPHLTHNGLRFDIEWLAYHAAKTLGWTVGEHRQFLDSLNARALDSAVFVKAKKLGMQRKWNETFYDWGMRVMNTIAKGVKYNVTLCVEELGIDVTQLTAHRALGDCEMTHEIYKRVTV